MPRLAKLVNNHTRVSARARLVSDTPPGPPSTQPDAHPLAVRHAREIASPGFLTHVLSHERADSWLWVKKRGGQPMTLADELTDAISAEPAGAVPAVDVHLLGDDPEADAGMLNLVLAIYQRYSETRFKQRVRRIELNGELERARSQSAAAVRQLDDFRKANNVAGVKQAYDEAMAQVAPQATRRTKVVEALRKADREAVSLRKDLSKAKDDLWRVRRQLDHAREQRDYLRAHPTSPAETWQQNLRAKEREVWELDRLWRRLDNRVDRLDDEVADVEAIVARLVRERDKLDAEIARVVGDLPERWEQLRSQVEQLAIAARAAGEHQARLQAESAELPSLESLDDATSYAVVLQRARDAEPVAQPRAVRLAAIEALGELGDARAIGPLIDALDSDDREFRTSAAMALHRITGENVGTDPVRWREWRRKP